MRKCKYLVPIITCLCCSNGFAITTGAPAGKWGIGGTIRDNNYGEFILAGGIGWNKAFLGTWDDEAGLVAMFANKVTEHGAYLCPYQLQCKNKRSKTYSYTIYFKPTGMNVDQCAWFCERGYYGEGCTRAATGKEICVTGTSLPRRKDLKMKTYGEWTNEIEKDIHGFSTFNKNLGKHSNPSECDVVLTAIEFKEHGIKAAPLELCCQTRDWRNNNSYVTSVQRVGKSRMLCKQGYQPNADDTDCEPVNAQTCSFQTAEMCAGFDKKAFDENQHQLVQAGACWKYFCTDSTKAFTSETDKTCADCLMTKHGGSDPTNGLCKECPTGTIYDGWGLKGKCVPASSLLKQDLMYGKGKTRNSQKYIEDQCWVIDGTAEYKSCVLGGGAAKSASNTNRPTRANGAQDADSTDEDKE